MRVYRIPKNFHDKTLLQNAPWQHFAKKSFAKGSVKHSRAWLEDIIQTSRRIFHEKNFCNIIKSVKFVKVFFHKSF